MPGKWLAWTGLVMGIVLIGLFVAGMVLARRVEPFIREQTVAYLQKRFAADIELGSFRVSLPLYSPADILVRGGHGAKAHITAERVSLRPQNHTSASPLLAMRALHFEVDLPSLWSGRAIVGKVRMEGLEIYIPPKGAHRALISPTVNGRKRREGGLFAPTSVLIKDVRADGCELAILPQDPSKAPLIFHIHRLQLDSAGPDVAMLYHATLTNAKPPGLIQCDGAFGPWVADNPAESPVNGRYRFDNADLSVFKGIAGRLHSTGAYRGRLNEILVDGETRTPHFRLTVCGNRVPLETKFHAIVDGTNGNTLLEPVEAKLADTTFDVRGGVVRNAGEQGKTVQLDVLLKQGRIDDLLQLAVKGNRPAMHGGVALQMKFTLPPGTGEIADRLGLEGTFRLKNAHFTSSSVRNEIDSLSRRTQGEPGNLQAEEVPAQMQGRFVMARGVINFRELRFIIPGAYVELAGSYTFEKEKLDFHGKLRTQAHVSQMVSGWKHWVLKPADPFFAKEGYGAVISIKVAGTREKPQFGLDRGRR
jgi:hypothetical protein